MQELKSGVWTRPNAGYLAGRGVSMDRLNAARDAADLYQATHGSDADAAMWRYLPYGPFTSAEAMAEWLAWAESSADPLFYTVRLKDTKRAVGVVALLNVSEEMGRAEIGHVWYSPAVHRTGVNTETVYLLLRYLLEDLRYRRVEWKCDSDNQASRRAALRLGFQYEGLFRQHLIVKGKNRDTAWFSIIDSDWPRVREHFRRHFEEGVPLGALNAPDTRT